MKATEFVKKHGWEDVISALRSTTREETAAFESTDLEPILSKKGSHIGFNVKIHKIKYDDVERLVESHELIERCGGIDACKRKVDKQKQKPSKRFICWVDCNGKDVTVYEMLQAIADVEACQ